MLGLRRRCVSPGGSLHHREDLAPDCRVVVGEDIYFGHSVVLAARSDFFLAAFTSDMVERASYLVTLQHVPGDRLMRESVLALLYFLYTGRTDRVNGTNAMEVLALVGDEQASDCCDEQGGYLQLRDAGALRQACEAAAESTAASGAPVGMLAMLVQADALGAARLKERMMQLAVHHFKDLAFRDAFESLPRRLLSEVLRAVAVEYDRVLPSAAKGVSWELSVAPKPLARLDNTYAAVSSTDLSCGAGACSTAGCSEASVVATFGRQVRVRRIRVGVELYFDFDGGARLNGCKLQYLNGSGAWTDAGVSVVVEDGAVKEIDLPQVLVSKAFRLVRQQTLAVGLLVFE